MAKLRYTEEELLREDDYAQPHVVGGRRLHGGFDAAGRYVSPRMAQRAQAVAAWADALRERGGELMPADVSLLSGARVPSVAQQKLLLQEGLGQTFWNTLTIIGEIEARGRVLADLPLSDFQQAVEEDISEMALGHLHKGLLKAHGLDEGGEPDKGIGGHDEMGFALRDLAFGPTDFPDPEVPATITRPEQGPPFPELAKGGPLLSLLLNLLMIEFRAELNFASTEALLRDHELFRERRREAEQAAVMVQRIRQDEEIHVTSLRLYLGELSQLNLRTTDGGTVSGRELIERHWSSLVQWATVEQPRLAAERSHRVLSERISAHPQAPRIQARFDALA